MPLVKPGGVCQEGMLSGGDHHKILTMLILERCNNCGVRLCNASPELFGICNNDLRYPRDL